ncbi:hypothetical protein D8674_018088 [Pyrus ussuriensis x Pyrus communis]|uniref:DEUBAD domain-containing protein n=1 Tax=Pyrus ussuriensis x Pyrus communis TaxID=2448454 RepID=A0A5N5G3T3_9ROSA|nr:hypothetical protein D8674_018088 [Pyrus ussuriensis x Pyrus communis]
MAADQRRKRVNGVIIASCNSREQHKAKKKNIELLQDDSNIKPHISLEWDGNQNMVVAKRYQIGISRRTLRPFVDSAFNSHNTLADVFAVPEGIYDLENLEDVLSYEVWNTHLSEIEKNHLMQFLPSGAEAEEVVQALLAGGCFDFGRPFLKWGASLCSGDFHPDAILRREQCLKKDKKTFYNELQMYHNDMIAYLQKLKERCASCKDPEQEIVQNMWRLRNDVEKQIFSHANESRSHELEENAIITSESCSWEKACSSDNQISSVNKGGDFRNRIREKGFLKDKGRNLLVTPDGAHNAGGRSKKADNLHKRNNYSSDGAKYMSYVKISKKQYEIVKRLKQSGKSIQSRSLNRILGNLDSFDVQPYEVFLEEEQKKLHQHWLQLAIKDIPAAYANWIEMHLQRRQMTNSLEKDMKRRLKPLIEDDEGDHNLESVLQDKIAIEATKRQSPMEDDERSVPSFPQGDEYNPTDMEEDNSREKLTGGHECNPADIDSYEHFSTESDNDSEKHIIIESDHSPPNVPDYAEYLNTADTAVSQGAQLCASGDAWKAVNVPHSYYDSTTSHAYSSASELSLAHLQVNEVQQTHLVAMESDLPVGDSGKDLLHIQSENGSFSSYQNQDRNELLQSLFKGQSMLSYNTEKKQTGLDFRTPANVFMGRFPVHFEEQQHQSLPLEQGQKRESEVYMQPRLSENVYSDGGGYINSRPEHPAAVDVQDWAVNSVRMPRPLQSHLDGGEMLSHNWFSGEHQVHGGWSASGGTSVTSQTIGNGTNADQSLFSVLSHCNQLRSSSPYQHVASTEQFFSSRSYGTVGGATPRIGNVVPQAGHELDYLGGREAATPMMHDDMQWMNLPRQNSGLRDPMGKPFLRSWNP